ncbi:MAG: DNA repair exonuclease [Ruminococcaceae bacterium]|nr:DNA repair exonuclease [Oscillospiraceae bacterium]
MGVRILHCADVHIGASAGIKRISTRRKAEVLQTFLRIVSYAEENQADLLLIAGDLFDSHKPSKDILEQISSAFSEFSGKVFITPGNHDYYGENTFWESWELPENVMVFKNEAEGLELSELGVKIHGGGFSDVYRNDHILKQMRADESMINIAVIHGDISSDTPYGPVTVEEIQNSNMDYIALGHIHKRSDIIKEGKTSYAYSGCPEGQGFDELYEKGFYFGTVEKGKVEMSFIPICRRRFVEEEVDVSTALKKSDIKNIILHKIDEKYGDEGKDWLYKIVLTGESAVSFSATELGAELESELYFVKIKNKVKTPLKDLTLIAEENSVRGIFVRKMLERAERGENIENAVRIGLAAFSEEVDFDED